MPTFQYRARDSAGALVKGTMVADNERLVKLKVTEMGYHPVAVDAMKEKGERALGLFSRKVRHDDVLVFAWQFSAMINAGIPLIACLGALRDQTDSPELARILGEVRQRVQDGQSLSTAMARYPHVFSHVMISLIKAGETGGFLELSLERIALQMEKDADLRQRVRSAFVYPVVVITLAAAVVAFLLGFVIPVFARVYGGVGMELPRATQLLIGLSDFFTAWWWALGLALTALALGVRAWARSDKGRPKADAMKLRMPLFGRLLHKISVARCVRVLGTMISSGVPLVQALEDAARVAGNYVVATALRDCIVWVTRGDRLAQAMERTEQFPAMVLQMVGAGEESGDLGGMLNKVADFYDRDIEFSVKRLTTLLDPILVIVLGVIVGFVAISMYLPIFNLTGMLRQDRVGMTP